MVIQMTFKRVTTKYGDYEISAIGFSRDGEGVFSCQNDCNSCPLLCEIGQLNKNLRVGE